MALGHGSRHDKVPPLYHLALQFSLPSGPCTTQKSQVPSLHLQL